MYSRGYVGNLFKNVGLQLSGSLGGSYEREIKQNSMKSHKGSGRRINKITNGTLVIVVTNTKKRLTLKVLTKCQFLKPIKKNFMI